MKHLFVIASVLAMLPVAGFSEQYSYAKDMYGDLNVGYGAKPTPYKDLFYLGGRGELSFLTWKNKYDSPTLSGSDSFSFKPLLGLDVFVGYRFEEKWRVDAEFGYITEFSESETGYYAIPSIPGEHDIQRDTFSLQTYNLTANVYYDFTHNLYVGAGVGVAISEISLEDSTFGKVSSTNASPMGALMIGWVNKLDTNTDFDIRYRLSVSGGGDVKIKEIGFKTDVDYIIDNSISAGIRCYF